MHTSPNNLKEGPHNKVKILIVDRTRLDSRILEILLKSDAEITVRHNAWSTIKFLNAKNTQISAALIEADLLFSTTVYECWRKYLKTNPRCRLIALIAAETKVPAAKLTQFHTAAALTKPYRRSQLNKMLALLDK